MKNKSIKIVYYTIFAILLVIVGYSLCLIFTWLKESRETNDIQKNIVDNNKVEVIKEGVSSNKNDNNYLSKYLERNSDTVAFMQVNLTKIAYPVVQTNDNDFYLNHDFNKRKTSSGWVFMDYQNKKDFSDDNTVIYAHNRNDKSMFGSLDNLLKVDLNNEFPLIYISLENKKIVYEVFSVYTVKEEEYYIKTSFNNNEKEEWINKIKSRNQSKINVSVNKEDNVLTLSTCYNNDDYRLVVHAKKIS